MVSKRLVASYVWDWVVIIAIFAAGGGLSYVQPYMRPFSLLSLDNSYPVVQESITTATLVVVALIAPAAIIFIVALFLVPGPRYSRTLTRRQLIHRKLWEWEKGWAGLALSVATAFFITQAMKNMFGKARPDMLARCQPDLSNIANYVVGGYGQDISSRWTLVTSAICTQTDIAVLHDGFRSFPSGHSSWSWSGLLYLSLFLCSKFGLQIPYLPSSPAVHDSRLSGSAADSELLPLHRKNHDLEARAGSSNGNRTDTAAEAEEAEEDVRAFAAAVEDRNRAAAPPVYLIVVAFVPIAVAIYICSTRYVEFYHFGFDIISGSLIGIISSWLAFRLYHLPISRGGGWAWGARSRDRAFGIGVGVSNYVGTEGWDSALDAARRPQATAHA